MAQPLHLILTGPPGIGKTTLVTKVCNLLKQEVQESASHLSSRNYNIAGFYTSEIREAGARVGFQIITLDGEIGTLSHVNSKSRKRVGRFGVELEQFEKVALPQFQRLESPKHDNTTTKATMNILVIDEIGKMELFSEPFKTAVQKAFAAPNFVILATIPIKSTRGAPIQFVESIRNAQTSQIFTVNVNNRNGLVEEIVNKIKQ